MQLQNIVLALALAAVGSTSPVKRNGGEPEKNPPTTTPPTTTPPSTTPSKPSPSDCATRDDGNTAPKYCPTTGVSDLLNIPASLCGLVADVSLGLNLLSCCGPSSCVAIDVLSDDDDDEPETEEPAPPSTPSPSPEDCATRDDGNTSPKYCPTSGLGSITVPASLCGLVADVTLGLNLLSCCGPESCVPISILS